MQKQSNISMIARANAKSIATQLVKTLNGLGQSKVAAKHSSGLKGMNGHAKSDLVHSAKSMDNFKSVAKNYFQHIKNTEGGRIEKNINIVTAKDFILTKLTKDGLEGSSANTYISILSKVAEGLEKMTNKVYITQGELKQMKKEIKQEHDLQKVHRNRAYENPDQIVKEMQKFSEFALSTKLQCEIGLRADDAINSAKWKLNSNGTLTVNDSKNGMTYVTAPLCKETQQEILEAQKNSYAAAYTTYIDELKEAVENSGQIWDKNESHGLRYNFAQERMQSLIVSGKSYYEAKAQVSLEMGHSRLSITDTYTSFKK